MTNFALKNIEMLIRMISMSFINMDSSSLPKNEVDSFYFPETEINNQSYLVDSYLEQVCNIY